MNRNPKRQMQNKTTTKVLYTSKRNLHSARATRTRERLLRVWLSSRARHYTCRYKVIQ